MPIKTVYKIAGDEDDYALLVEESCGCISLTVEGSESIMITKDQARDLISVFLRLHVKEDD
jgi:hypothetical protein